MSNEASRDASKNPSKDPGADGISNASVPVGSSAAGGAGNQTWMCLICGWVYDEAVGLPEEGIAAGTRWDDVPINWTCPECGARKEDFEMVTI